MIATYTFTTLLILVLISSNLEAHPVVSAVGKADISDLARNTIRSKRVSAEFKQGHWRSNLMGRPKDMPVNRHHGGSSSTHIKKKEEEMYKTIQKKGKEAHNSWLNSIEAILKSFGHH